MEVEEGSVNMVLWMLQSDSGKSISVNNTVTYDKCNTSTEGCCERDM